MSRSDAFQTLLTHPLLVLALMRHFTIWGHSPSRVSIARPCIAPRFPPLLPVSSNSQQASAVTSTRGSITVHEQPNWIHSPSSAALFAFCSCSSALRTFTTPGDELPGIPYAPGSSCFETSGGTHKQTLSRSMDTLVQRTSNVLITTCGVFGGLPTNTAVSSRRCCWSSPTPVWIGG